MHRARRWRKFTELYNAHILSLAGLAMKSKSQYSPSSVCIHNATIMTWMKRYRNLGLRKQRAIKATDTDYFYED